MRKITVLFTAALLAAGSLAIAAAPPEKVTLKAKNGDVTFNHKSHGDRLKCAACHEGAPAKMAPLGMAAGHKLCLDCHKAQGAPAPTKCNECHQR